MLEIGDKSLTLRATESALQKNIDVILSSNNQEILNHVNLPGVLKHFRTPGTSTALSKSEHSVLEVINSFNIPDTSEVMLLQPTSPFRSHATVERFLSAWSELHSEGYDSAFSAFIDHSEFWTDTQVGHKRISSILSPTLDAYRTQDRPPLYRENGAIYLTKAQNLREGNRFVNGRSFVFPCTLIESVDIDTEEDYKLASAIYLGNPDACN
jgi:CMP-N-acetylneuraminic acid synthetase